MWIFRLLSVVLFIMFSSCGDSGEGLESGAGCIRPLVSVNADVTVATDVVQSTLVSSVPSVSDLSLRVKSADGIFSRIWDSVDDYPVNEPLLQGEYIVEAFNNYNSTLEGFDTPIFYGRQQVSVTSDRTVDVEVECRLTNSMFRVEYSERLLETFPEFTAVFHTDGGSYITYPPGEKRALYLMPGDVEVGVRLTMADGRRADFQMTSIKSTKACYYYNASFDVTTGADGVPAVCVSFDEKALSDDVVVRLTTSFLDSPSPEIRAEGFASGETVTVAEGKMPPNALKAVVPLEGLRTLSLSSTSALQNQAPWPVEANLLGDAATLATMKELGLGLTIDSLVTVDFTDVIPRIPYNSLFPVSAFILSATTRDGKMSMPVELRVRTAPVDITLVKVGEAVIGIDSAYVDVRAGDSDLTRNLGIEILGADGAWSRAEILSISYIANDIYRVCFAIPGGGADLQMRGSYCGVVKFEAGITRNSPSYEIRIDPFALRAVIQVMSADPALRGTITSLVNLYSGSDKLLAVSRDEAKGIVTLTGLEPDTRYTIRTTVKEHPTQTDFTVPVSFTTEHISTIPNGDFEDVKPTLKFKDMASGGRYSQTIVAIYNQQNRTSFDLSTPQEWANTNAKTFCTSARNKNTWYMEPSVYTVFDSYSGAYGVKLQSVAWDTDGEAIPDYLQTGQPYLSYNPNIPAIAHRAAGKLFLGHYSFDASTGAENYSYGVRFGSRPSALNGFYKYIPDANCPSDAGLARVEVIGTLDGTSTVIASGEVRLEPRINYTAFSVPLVYHYFGVKAESVRVMFASSVSIGSIDEETAAVATTPAAVTATSIGSTLWLDDVTFSY